MANENDVVRLKHLNSLASVVHDITLHSGGDSQALPDNADFALYVPNDTSIIITGKQAPVLSLGSWSSADTVYSAPITYTGDGTLSTDIGTISNDILTVADADGNFNGVISASSGNDFAATKTNFSYNSTEVIIPPKPLPSLVLGSWSAVDSVYSAPISYSGDGALSVNIGSISNGSLTIVDEDGNFSGVISAAEGNDYGETSLAFNYNTDAITVTIQGAKSNLQKVLDNEKTYELTQDNVFLFGKVTVGTSIESNGACYLTKTIDGQLPVKSNSGLRFKSSYTDNFEFVAINKLNEKEGEVLIAETRKNGDYLYDGTLTRHYFDVNETETFTISSSVVTCRAAVNSIQAANAGNYTVLLNKFNGIDFVLFNKMIEESNGHYTVSVADKSTVNNFAFNNTSWTTYDAHIVKSYNAVCTPDNDKMIIKKGNITKNLPIYYYEISNDSVPLTVYKSAKFEIGFPLPTSNATVYSSEVNFSKTTEGVTTTNYSWFEDNDNIILGVYPHKTLHTLYVITFKEGTYDKSTWLDECFTIRGVQMTLREGYANGYIPKIFDTNLKLTDIIDDLLL